MLTHLAATGDDADDTFRNAGLDQQLGQQVAVERRLRSGLTTTVQPASSAGTSFDRMVNCGTFHGGMAATTPTGSWRTTTSAPSAPGRVDSHGNSRAIARNASICIHGAGACASELNEIGEPISVEMIVAISSSLAA